MDFEKILLDLHAALDKGRSLVKEYQQKLHDITEREQDAINLKHRLDAQVKDMQAREAAVSKIENIQKLHKDAIELHDRANSRVNAAAEAEKALNQRILEENSKLDEKRKALAKEEQNYEKRKKAIDDEVQRRVKAIIKQSGLSTGDQDAAA